MSDPDEMPRVLVVDDEKVIADTLTAILALHRYEATPVYSGEDALQWIERFRPDIVLSDIQMKSVNGVDAAVRIQKAHPECRVILFTATQMSEVDLTQIAELGFEFIQRPMHPADLLAQLTMNPH